MKQYVISYGYVTFPFGRQLTLFRLIFEDCIQHLFRFKLHCSINLLLFHLTKDISETYLLTFNLVNGKFVNMSKMSWCDKPQIYPILYFAAPNESAEDYVLDFSIHSETFLSVNKPGA